jgi:hypothetical protein
MIMNMIDASTLSNKEFYALNGSLTTERTENLIHIEKQILECNIKEPIGEAIACLTSKAEDSLVKHVDSIDRLIHALPKSSKIIDSLIEIRDALGNDIRQENQLKEEAHGQLNQALSLIPDSIYEG